MVRLKQESTYNKTKHKYKKDTYEDAANYLHQAELMQSADANIYRDWIVGFNKWKKKNGRNN